MVTFQSLWLRFCCYGYRPVSSTVVLLTRRLLGLQCRYYRYSPVFIDTVFLPWLQPCFYGYNPVSMATVSLICLQDMVSLKKIVELVTTAAGAPLDRQLVRPAPSRTDGDARWSPVRCHRIWDVLRSVWCARPHQPASVRQRYQLGAVTPALLQRRDTALCVRDHTTHVPRWLE